MKATNIPLLQLQKNFSEMIHRSDLSAAYPVWGENRIFIYRNAYKIRLHESLGEDFPHIVQVIGKKNAAQLFESYLSCHPSQYWTLAEVGCHLSKFIYDSHWNISFPFLSDLAHLEWLKILSLSTVESQPFDFSYLANLPKDEQFKVKLALAPSVKLFYSSWALHQINPQGTPPQSHTWLALVQRNFEVMTLEICKSQFEILEKISSHITLHQLGIETMSYDQNQLTHWFQDWVIHGLITKSNSA